MTALTPHSKNQVSNKESDRKQNKYLPYCKKLVALQENKQKSTSWSQFFQDPITIC